LPQVENCSAGIALGGHPVKSGHQVIHIPIVCTLAVNEVKRLTDPITVLDPPPADVLYESTPAVISFTFINRTTNVVTGRVVARLGETEFPTAYWVVKVAPKAHVDGQIKIGPPLSTGTLKLLYEESDSQLLPGNITTIWKTITSVTQQLQVLPEPTYVARAPYDLVFDGLDDNGFPLNPRWGKQDKYFFQTHLRNLLVADARPDILTDAYSHAEPQDIVGVDNDYDGFRNAYCKHSPGATVFNSYYCDGDKEDTTEPGGPIYGASFAWKDAPIYPKCGISGDYTNPYNDGDFGITFHNQGHENFGVVTFDGILDWDNAQPEYFYDSDWGIDLYTRHGIGVTGRKPIDNYIHTEFDPHDVGDDWDHGFWGALSQNIHNAQGGQCCGDVNPWAFKTSGAVIARENETVAPIINGHRAIVIGLIGLDVGHDDAQVELHPVYGMAIHTGGRPLANSDCRGNDGDPMCQGVYLNPDRDPHFDELLNSDDDTWAIFATNFGNEGYCSTRALHVLDGDESIIGRKDFPTMTFRLPWASETGSPMADAAVKSTTNFTLHAQVDVGTTDVPVDIMKEKGKDIIVTFHMLPASVRSDWYGEIHIKWTPTLVLAKHIPLPVVMRVDTARASQTAIPLHADVHPNTIGMSETQRRVFASELARAPKAARLPTRVSFAGALRLASAPPAPPPQRQWNSFGIVPARAKKRGPGAAAEDSVALRALCVAYDGHVPGLPTGFCK